MGRRHQPAEELEETLEDVPADVSETAERELPDSPTTPFARPSSSASRRNGPKSLEQVVEFNLNQQVRRMQELAEVHEKKSTILDGLTARLEALQEILEDHLASQEEALERLEMVVAAHIKLIQSQTGRRELGENQNKAQSSSNTSSTDDSEHQG
jgi:hypothetical protein